MTRRGGARPGAGRPRGQGRYGEPTKPLRIPQTLVEDVKQFVAHRGYKLPLYASKVQAGFPSPADDQVEDYLDLNEHLIQHPSATFFVRASGQSMVNAGIHDGDVLVVDRSLQPKTGKIVIAAVYGELTVKRLQWREDKWHLLPDNPDFEEVEVSEEADVTIWGVVTNVIHAV